MIRHYSSTPATLPGTSGNRSGTCSDAIPAPWQHFRAQTQTLTQHGSDFPRIPGNAPAVILSTWQQTTKNGLK